MRDLADVSVDDVLLGNTVPRRDVCILAIGNAFVQFPVHVEFAFHLKSKLTRGRRDSRKRPWLAAKSYLPELGGLALPFADVARSSPPRRGPTELRPQPSARIRLLLQASMARTESPAISHRFSTKKQRRRCPRRRHFYQISAVTQQSSRTSRDLGAAQRSLSVVSRA